MGLNLPEGKRFFCREWVFSKLHHSLENLEKELEESVEGTNVQPIRKTGILIVGGAGAGKTSICSEIVFPTVAQGKQWTLRKHLLGYHFCQRNDWDTLSIEEFIIGLVEQFSNSQIIPEYKLFVEKDPIQQLINNLMEDPQNIFKKIIIQPLNELKKPKHCCFLLIDSIDERSCDYSSQKDSSTKGNNGIEELLLNNIDSFPSWLIPIFTARKQNKSTQMSSFRKISIDDLRKPQVVRDVQQYILLRLDEDDCLRDHITRETAEMLNHLHIKSNGCLLYIEKVLDGLADNFILLREIREIPGTLNGLYLWMCQRLFTKRQFSKITTILSVLLASRKPLLEEELFLALQMNNKSLTHEDFTKRMQIIKRVVKKLNSGYVVMFHQSFAEWLLDVKYCSRKFLCELSEGHAILATLFSHLAPHLQEKGIAELGHHLLKASILDVDLHHLLILSSGINVNLIKHLAQMDGNIRKVLKECIYKKEDTHSNINQPNTILNETKIEETNENIISKSEYLDTKDQIGATKQLIETETYENCSFSSETKDLFIVESNSAIYENRFSNDGKITKDSCFLHESILSGNVEFIEYLLTTGVDVNCVDRNGKSALHIASRHGFEDIVTILLEANCEPDQGDKDGWTPLCAASSQGHLGIVLMLIESNADVNHRDRDGATPLLIAAFEGHLKICEALLESEADIDCCDKVGRNPLWAAASMGHCNVAELLLFWGAYVDHIDGDGRTVLSVASAQGNVGVVKLLLARGLDEGHRDNLGWTPLHYAAFEGHREVCEALIEAGARVNDVDNDGYHALLLASQEGHVHVVKSLINYETDLDNRSHDGQTALRVAAIEGFKDIVQLLVNEGANVNYCDMDGRSTLYLLALENRVRMAQFLILCGADVEGRDFEGRTPLHVSAWQGHLKMVELLLSAGGIVDALDNDKRTPLQNAAWQGHHNIVKLLCERSAQVDHMCNQGATPLCISVQCGHVECVQVLLQYGANPTRSDKSGRTPVKVALKSNHSTILRLLEQSIQYPIKSHLEGDIIKQMKSCGIHDEEIGSFPEGDASMQSQRENHISNRCNVSPQSPLLSPSITSKLEKQNMILGDSNLCFSKQVEHLIECTGEEEFRRIKPTISPLYSSPPPLSPPSTKPTLPPLNVSSPLRIPTQYSRGYTSKDKMEHQLMNEFTQMKSPLEPYIRSSSNVEMSGSRFAFTRDSHMKIILGSNEVNTFNKGKKGALSYIQNGSSITNATNVIRNGLSALKAGVLDGKSGGAKKSLCSDSPLVSAASLAVPNVVLQNKSKKGSSNYNPSAIFPKKETQL